jgi:hypothetical protein
VEGEGELGQEQDVFVCRRGVVMWGDCHTWYIAMNVHFSQDTAAAGRPKITLAIYIWSYFSGAPRRHKALIVNHRIDLKTFFLFSSLPLSFPSSLKLSPLL